MKFTRFVALKANMFAQFLVWGVHYIFPRFACETSFFIPQEHREFSNFKISDSNFCYCFPFFGMLLGVDLLKHTCPFS